VEETRPPTTKQTVFNDQNYQPKSSINIKNVPQRDAIQRGATRVIHYSNLHNFHSCDQTS